MPPRPRTSAAAFAPRCGLARTPPEIVRGPGTTVHAQIEDWLADAIAAGALAPGDRMPTEHDLAAWLGVSRMTLRHALGELARRGLVTRAVGRNGGTFVAEAKLEQDLTTLAGFSEQLRRHGMVAGARVLSAAERPAGPAAAAALELAEGDPVYEVRRIRLADGKPIVLEHSLFPAGAVSRHAGLPAGRLAVRAARGQVRAAAAPGPGEPGAGRPPECGRPRRWRSREGAPLMLVERTAYARRGPAGRVRPRPVPRRPDPDRHVDLGTGGRVMNQRAVKFVAPRGQWPELKGWLRAVCGVVVAGQGRSGVAGRARGW